MSMYVKASINIALTWAEDQSESWNAIGFSARAYPAGRSLNR